MSPDALTFYQGFFTQIWRLLTGFYIPGTQITPALMIVGGFVIEAFFMFFQRAFGLLEEPKEKKEKSNKNESE